jgi:Family of unknown function (DUF6445)
MFTRKPLVQAVPLFDGHECLIVDDVLQAPEQWLRYAVERRAQFYEGPPNAYPGLELRMPDEISAQLDDFFREHIRARLGARRTLRMYSRLSLVTTPPQALEPRQWLCHRDSQQVQPGECIAASVLYLFREAALGGTSFFRPKQSAMETAHLVHDSSTLTREAFTQKHGINAGYFTESNAYFEHIYTASAKFNRMIFYDGSLFHSGDITAPEKMSANPAVGRLTLNGFFTCKKQAT